MTISATGNRFTYAGNGTTTAFSFPREFVAATDLDVYLVDDATGVATLLAYVTDYTVTGAGSPTGGTVTLNVAPLVDKTVVIVRDTALTQGLDLDNSSAVNLEALENALDRSMLTIDEIDTRLRRAVQPPIYSTDAFDYTLPKPVPDKVLGINSSGNGFVYMVGATGPDGATGATGPQGPIGPTGPAGTNGTNGTNGIDGAAGATGPAGPTGPTGAAGAGQLVWFGDTPPGDTATYPLWFDTSGAQLYGYMNDGDSSQWVSTSVPGPVGLQGATGPAGPSPVWATATITLPGTLGGRLEHRETVTAAGVTTGSFITVRLAPALDTDENDPELLDVHTLIAVPGTGSFDVIATFDTRQSGAIKIQYEVN